MRLILEHWGTYDVLIITRDCDMEYITKRDYLDDV
jgi:hypothetical protein